MTDPAITGAIEALIASTPPPVTVWGVRYLQQIEGRTHGIPFAIPAGRIDWCDTETEAREWLAEEQAAGCLAELVSINGDTAVRFVRVEVRATNTGTFVGSALAMRKEVRPCP